MKLYSIIFFLLLGLPIYGQIGQMDLDLSLSRLDSVLLHRDSYENPKKERIKKLTALFDRSGLSHDERLKTAQQLYYEYASFQFDTAYFYAQQVLDLSKELNDKNRLVNGQVNMARIYSSAGLFKESHDIMSHVDTTGVSADTRGNVINFMSSLTAEMAFYIGQREPEFSQYIKNLSGYVDEIRSFLPASDGRITFCELNLYTCLGEHKKALEIEKRNYEAPHSNLHDYAIKSVCLGRRYLQLGDTLKGIYYITEAAIADIKNVTRETTATRMLAEVLYAQGDIERAYRYAREAINDAEFYDSRKRGLEIANIFPNIENQRYKIIKNQKNQILFSFVTVSFLFIALLIAGFIILKQIARSKKDRQTITLQNSQLMVINAQLSETSRIKDECIGQMFDLHSTYLERLDEFRRMVVRKIQARQYDDLLNLNKKNDWTKERENMFISFDNTFLKLFPDFVDKFNLLFEPENRIVLKKATELTPELRIFALIRLGISESERIAQFLNYSVHTINTYKTRVKNRSFISNEQFETVIMQIESVK